MNDPWIHEEDDANATPETGDSGASAAPVVQKPNVAADPAIPTLVLPKPEVSAESEVQESEPGEKSGLAEFPNDYGECIQLLHEGRGHARLGDNASRAQKAAHAKYKRLQAHTHAIQQGAPVLHADSSKPAAFVGLHSAALSDTKLRYLARSNREVKALLEQRDALIAENDKLKAANAALESQLKK